MKVKRNALAARPRLHKGFSLVELAMVLVIIGVVMGSVVVGTDVLRQAKGQKAFSSFVVGWRDAFSQFTQVMGRVPGDNAAAPANAVQGTVNTLLCNGPPSALNALSNAFLGAGIRIPQGVGFGSEDRYRYQDSDSSPHTLRVCFVTTAWSVQQGAVGVFANQNRHVMQLTDLTTELAIQMDVLIDGNVDARFGQFRLWGQHNLPTGTSTNWGNLQTQTGAQSTVTAVFEMF